MKNQALNIFLQIAMALIISFLMAGFLLGLVVLQIPQKIQPKPDRYPLPNGKSMAVGKPWPYPIKTHFASEEEDLSRFAVGGKIISTIKVACFSKNSTLFFGVTSNSVYTPLILMKGTNVVLLVDDLWDIHIYDKQAARRALKDTVQMMEESAKKWKENL